MFALLPSLIFFVLAPVSLSLALWLGFAAAFAIGLRAFGATRKIRPFDGAGLVLFGGLALYTAAIDPNLGPCKAALVVECGLLAAIVWSMAARQPFTARYHWLKTPQPPDALARAHLLLSSLWATVYAVMAAISAAAVELHKLSPVWAGILGLFVFAATLTFTWQFALYIDRRGALPGGRNKEFP